MVERRPIKVVEAPRALDYFSSDFIPTGSFLLNLVLGGGWARKRVANLVGDKSSGKTLLAIEACANFAKHVGEAEDIRYAETESAFLEEYAHKIGMPQAAQLTKEEDGIRTVEDWYNDLDAFLKEQTKRTTPCFYVLDSLDALSDDAEADRAFGENTYGTGKAKGVSELFRRKISDIAKADCAMLIISQIRDNIGVTFGETKKRSGGRALDFYASQVVWLEIGRASCRERVCQYV